LLRAAIPDPPAAGPTFSSLIPTSKSSKGRTAINRSESNKVLRKRSTQNQNIDAPDINAIKAMADAMRERREKEKG
jgi:hypothetical protein